MKIFNIGFIISLLIAIFYLMPSKNLPLPSYELLTEEKDNYIFYIFEEEIRGIPISFKGNKTEKILDAFAYLTKKSNAILSNGETYLIPSANILSYEIRNAVLYLEIDDNFLRIPKDKTRLALAEIFYTYYLLGYKNVYLVKDEEVLKELNGYNIEKGLATDYLVNLEIIDSLNATRIIFFYPLKDSLGLKNYIIGNNTDKIAFILNQIQERITKLEGTPFLIYEYYLGLNCITLKVNNLDIAYKYKKILELNFQNLKFKINFVT